MSAAWLRQLRHTAMGTGTGGEAPVGAGPDGPSVTRATEVASGGRGGGATVQRAGEPSGEGAAAPAPASASDGRRATAEAKARLKVSIAANTTQRTSKSAFAVPGTWVPEQWLPDGRRKQKRVLDRRVIRGEVFDDQELRDIELLSAEDPTWLNDVGIGTIRSAREYLTDRNYQTWLTLPAGARVLIATLHVRDDNPLEPSERPDGTPIEPSYTLGRFMLTESAKTSEEDKASLNAERDQQIRDTAVDTLHPAGVAPGRRHDGAGQVTPEHEQQDRQGREILTNVLLVLRHGLQLYEADRGTHEPDHTKDVIRALAHGGRVTVRIPKLDGVLPHALPDLLGVTDGGRRADGVSKRSFATHRILIKDDKGEEPGTFKEQGGPRAALANKLALGDNQADLWGVDLAGGGLGTRDWNGDIVLPDGSHGHMLLVFQQPTTKRAGALEIGIETTAPGAGSPVGYRHTWRSTEATANPESVLHGHKAGKVGSGGLSKNERFVELGAMGGDTHWKTFLEQVQADWTERLEATREGSAQRRALYAELVGPRPQPEES